MSQYDNFAKQWAALNRNGANLPHVFIEKPFMASRLPDLTGCSVLVLGCGSGEELPGLFKKGAAKVLAVDSSAALLEEAKAYCPNAQYQQCDIHALHLLEQGGFDFVYSGMVLHYADDWVPILAQIKSLLKPGGSMLFSVGHPVKWGSHIERNDQGNTFTLGYQRDANGMHNYQGDYLTPRLLTDTWFGSMQVSFYHRPLSAMINDILASGLRLVAMHEPKPVEAARSTHPDFYETLSRFPLFVVFEVKND